MNVMIVDDEKDIELLFKYEFRKEIKSGQLKLFFAFSAKEALTYLKNPESADFVFILSDINMPVMSGLDLLKEIKAQFPKIKVVMVTAYGDKLNYNKAMEFGAEGLINKPIDFSRIRTEIFKLDKG